MSTLPAVLQRLLSQPMAAWSVDHGYAGRGPSPPPLDAGTAVAESMGLTKTAHGDGSVLEELTKERHRDKIGKVVLEPLSATEYKMGAARRHFAEFAGFSASTPFSTVSPVVAGGCHKAAALQTSPYGIPQLRQQMAAFMPQPPQRPLTTPPAARVQSGTPPAAPGHPTLSGIPQRPIGLDRPMDTRAAALPGVPGHAATNVIDQRGGLDPRGLTVDGNNAAGVKKFTKFSVLRWLQEKQAADVATASTTQKQGKTAMVKVAVAPPEPHPENWPDHGPRRCRRCDNVHRCRCSASVHGELPVRVIDVCPGGCRAVGGRRKQATDTAALIAKGHGAKRCLGCGRTSRCRCDHGDTIPEQTTPDCYDCREGKA